MEHLSQKQIEDYSQNRLRGAELLAASDHLGECEACTRRVGAGMDVDAAFFAVREEVFALDRNVGAHLTSEQTAEYVDKNLAGDELQFVTDHLSSCEQCAFAVDDLRSFRNQIAPSLDREYGPASAVPVVRESWRQRFVSLFRVSPVPAFGAAALAILLLSFIGWAVWRTSKEERREVVVAPAPSLQPSPFVTPSVEVQPEPAQVVAQLNDGAGLSLDQQGNLSGAENLPPSYQELLRKTLTSQRIERSSQLQGLTRPPSSLMGANEKGEFSVLAPAGVVLMSDRPAFRWSRLEGATGYLVEVYDEQFKRVVVSPELTTLSWSSTQPLSRGQVYSWQVKAVKDGQEVTVPRPPAPQAKFRVIDQGSFNEISRAKRAYGSSHLTLALLYAKAGLLNEAEQELRLLQRANPQSEIVRKLLRQLR